MSIANARARPLNLLRGLVSKYGILLSLILLFVASSFASKYFLTPDNLSNLMRQVSINGILAVGVTFVILVGECDFSVSAIMAMATVVIGLSQGLPFVLTMTLALVIATLVGSANGMIITALRLDSFIVTLGSATFLTGLALIISKGRPIIIHQGGWQFFGSGQLWLIPVPGLIFLLAILVGQVVISYTAFGRYIFAIGGNEEAVRLSGINTRLYKAATFMIAGLTAGIGGFIMSGRVLLADATFGQGAMGLDALTAVVLGGTRFGGGKGTMWGTLVGALILGIINNLFNLLDVSAFYQYAFKGVIVIVAIAMSRQK